MLGVQLWGGMSAGLHGLVMVYDADVDSEAELEKWYQVCCSPFGALTSNVNGLWACAGHDRGTHRTALSSLDTISTQHCEARYNPLCARGFVPAQQLQNLTAKCNRLQAFAQPHQLSTLQVAILAVSTNGSTSGGHSAP